MNKTVSIKTNSYRNIFPAERYYAVLETKTIQTVLSFFFFIFSENKMKVTLTICLTGHRLCF